MSRSVVRLQHALFRAAGRSSAPVYIFQKPISFDILPLSKPVAWGILGPSKGNFLAVLAGKYVAEPRNSRRYLNDASLPSTLSGVQYFNFRDDSELDHAHLSARYESYSYKGVLEMSDNVNSVENYVTGANNHNSADRADDTRLRERLLALFNLQDHRNNWINSLSNGQRRRARIAKALYRRPLLLVIDDPFLGLDSQAARTVSEGLYQIMNESHLTLAMGLRLQDDVPAYISHLAYVDDLGLFVSGKKEDVSQEIHQLTISALDTHAYNTRQLHAPVFKPLAQDSVDDPIIEFENAHVSYRGKQVLRNFSWKVARGSRWRILGKSGSGKTTVLALITADHPQSWRSVLRVNGSLRKIGSGQTYFGINNNIGISSPELHAIVPYNMKMKDVVLNGLVPNVGNMNFQAKYNGGPLSKSVQCLWASFSSHLKPNEEVFFGELSVSLQKLALFLRAIIKNPILLILDEAFSFMDDEALVVKCHDFIAAMHSTVLTIGHIDWETPSYDKVLSLAGDESCSYKLYEVEH